jgi:phenol hydroxylase P0 protein
VNTASQDKPTLIADLARKYVCIKDVAADGSVRFDFAIGFPDLSVELVMPKAAFDEFCLRNDVQLIGADDVPPPMGAPIGEGE